MNPDPLNTWAIDREIVLSRVIAAPRERVFQAWTDPAHIAQWFGPDGFKTESLECDIRPGGRWRFLYTAPDGTLYNNRVTITFDAQSDGKTVLTMRQLHPTKEQRAAVIGFGAVEFGYQTIGKLERYLGVG